MNQRERYKRTMRRETVDRVPFWDYGYWAETMDVWKGQGMPQEVTDIEDFFRIEDRLSVGLNLGLCPAFEPEVIEEDERSRVIRDAGGIVQRESKVGSSIPQFLEFPVKSRRDWEEIKERFDPKSPERYPADWDDRVKFLNAQDKPVFVGISGYFGFLRDLFGIEGLSMMFYDDPGLILEISEHMTELRLAVLPKALREVKIDAGGAWEDMACNKGSLISPKMYRKFMLPFYRQVTGLLAESGVDIIIVDSDGDINELVPLFIESGITAALPFEVRAGNDIEEIRRRHPEFGIFGGIDKMALMRTRADIDSELDKVKRMLPHGAFIPAVDHRVPPDVPYENYVYYLREKWRIIHDAGSYGG